jgi:hypothetical protein
MTPIEQRQLLASELHTAGIAHLMHGAPGQRPHAGFRYAEARGPTLPFTATIRNGALQLMVHELVPPADPAGAAASVDALNAGWGVGQACYVRHLGNYRLTAGYPVFARRRDAPLLQLLLANLYTVGAALSAPDKTAWSDALSAAMTMRSAFPPADVAAVMRAMECALRGIGHPFRRVDEAGLYQSFHVPDGNAFAITIAPHGEGLIRVEARTAIGAQSSMLDRLNEAAPIGSFVAADSAAEMVHGWEFAAEFIAVTERLAAWLIEVAAQMTAAAERLVAPSAPAPLMPTPAGTTPP